MRSYRSSGTSTSQTQCSPPAQKAGPPCTSPPVLSTASPSPEFRDQAPNTPTSKALLYYHPPAHQICGILVARHTHSFNYSAARLPNGTMLACTFVRVPYNSCDNSGPVYVPYSGIFRPQHGRNGAAPALLDDKSTFCSCNCLQELKCGQDYGNL